MRLLSLQADFAPLLRLRLAAGPGLVPGPSPQRLVRQLPQLWGDPCHLDMFDSTYHDHVLHMLGKVYTAGTYHPARCNACSQWAIQLIYIWHYDTYQYQPVGIPAETWMARVVFAAQMYHQRHVSAYVHTYTHCTSMHVQVHAYAPSATLPLFETALPRLHRPASLPAIVFKSSDCAS